ncbi:MAG TPA: tyrosine-type recombinase/integrase [Solirubrobacteraceae bacterium]|nr:tyrosine-type recombinase/integrase [Solirubrobacteraceae bacterium]
MSATADLTVLDLLAKMSAGERAALTALLAREDVKDKSYQQLPMGREVVRYLAAKRKELTDSSYRGWESCLEKFARAFADLQLEDFELPRGADLIEPWMDDRWGGASPGTYNVNHAILKDFFRWQVKRRRMTSNPMELVGRARKQQVYRMTYSEDECRAILASAESLRDRIALRLLLYHGIRKGALQKIQFKHFDYQRRRLTIFTKGSKVKAIPLPEPAFWTDLERHVLEVEAQPDHYLACLVKPVPYGTPDAAGRRRTRAHRFPDRPMSSTALHRWWYARLNDAGIVAKGTTAGKKMHAARHTAGQRILDATGDLKLVQQFLGHASIQTTADVYVDYDVDQVASRLADVLRKDSEGDGA